MRIEVAQNVLEHLRKTPQGFWRGIDVNKWALWEQFASLTDEEGEVLSQIMPYGEHIDDIAKRLCRHKDELIPLLDNLLRKAWLGREGTKEDGYYRVLSWIPGLMELWALRFRNPEYIEFLSKRRLSQDNPEFGPVDALPWFRVLPREDAIPHNVEVYPSEILSHLIEHGGNEGIALMDCLCRRGEHLRGRGCDRPVHVCMFLGFLAPTVVECGVGELITKDEALKVLKRCRDAGLIHQVTTCEHITCICSCCSCCCVVLKGYLSGVRPSTLISNFEPDLNMELCIGCQSCVKTCPVKAITLDRKIKKPVFNRKQCIGCGKCVVECPEHALTLKRKNEVVTYPHTWDDFLRIRAQQSGKTEVYK